MLKRGQAAMEFLMTYGWTILAVLITIGALAYFGVLSPALFLPESVTLMPGLAARDFKILENAVIINVQNGMGKNFNDFYLRIPRCGAEPSIYGRSGLGSFRDGETRKFIIGCFPGIEYGEGSKVNEDIEIHFTEGSLSHTRFGKINGRAEKGKLLLYYSFDLSFLAIDLSGNGNTGLLSGGIDCSVQGKYGNGCEFHGTVDHIIRNPISAFQSDEVTAEYWLKTSDTTMAYSTHISYAEAGLDNSLLLGGSLSGGIQRFSIQRGIPPGAGSPVPFNDGIWQHFLATWRSSDGQVIFYKNGIQYYSSNLPLTVGSTINGGGSLALGREQDCVGGCWDVSDSQSYIGILDEVAIYSTIT